MIHTVLQAVIGITLGVAITAAVYVFIERTTRP